MVEAVARIGAAIASGHRIGVFGDYDVDGISGTALLTRALRHALSPGHVLPVLPEREAGYGLSEAGIDRVVAFGASQLICVDCGSTDDHHVSYALARGLDVVILDHHQMAGTGPAGATVASPHLGGTPYVHDLTGVGLAYIAVCGLEEAGVPVAAPGEPVSGYLDLVALGTVADVAPLFGINRALVRDGLEVLRRTRRPGISALIAQTGRSQEKLEASDIAFQLAPRINAAGRLASPVAALDLLLCENPREALELAADLDRHNLVRRSKQDAAVQAATASIIGTDDWRTRPFVTAVSPEWEKGLVGVVAGRLCEQLRRPVVVFRQEGETLVGSARSVAGFDIGAALRDVDHLLDRHGGHALAAGLTLPSANLAAFEAAMLEAVGAADQSIPAARRLRIDANLDGPHTSLATIRAIAQLQPFGQGNPSPVFRIVEATLEKYSTMSENRHLKLFVSFEGRRFEAIMWNGGWRSRDLVMVRRVDLLGKLDENVWNGQSRLQMVLEDFRAHR
jgi:single-stranded-DNA-specific exonuclease